jgi:hypothetical protein
MSTATRTIQTALSMPCYREPVKLRAETKTCISPSTAGLRCVCACLLLLLLTPDSFAASGLTFSPDEAAFGTVVIGETKTLSVRATNVSGSAIAITNISVEGFSSFRATAKCPAEIPAGASCMVEVSFRPVSGAGYHGEQTAIIVFYDGTTVLASLHADGHAL